MGRPKKVVSEEIIKQYNLELKIANSNSSCIFNKTIRNTFSTSHIEDQADYEHS